MFELTVNSADIDPSSYLKDSSYREAIHGGQDNDNPISAEIKMLQKESDGNGAVLDRPPPESGFASKEM